VVPPSRLAPPPVAAVGPTPRKLEPPPPLTPSQEDAPFQKVLVATFESVLKLACLSILYLHLRKRVLRSTRHTYAGKGVE